MLVLTWSSIEGGLRRGQLARRWVILGSRVSLFAVLGHVGKGPYPWLRSQAATGRTHSGLQGVLLRLLMLLQKLLLMMMVGGNVGRRASRRPEMMMQGGGVEERMSTGPIVQIGRAIGRSWSRLGPLTVVALARTIGHHVAQSSHAVLIVIRSQPRVFSICGAERKSRLTTIKWREITDRQILYKQCRRAEEFVQLTKQIVIFGVLIVIVVVIDVGIIVVDTIPRLPGHFVFLFQSSSRISKPGGYLGERHFSDDRQHYLLALGRIRVLLVLVQPGLQRGCRLARCVLAPSSVQVHAITAMGRKCKVGVRWASSEHNNQGEAGQLH